MSIPFVHLHVHTDFSLLDGTTKCKDIAKTCKEMGMTACAITDHGNMSGTMEFIDVMQKEGLKPIIGCEFYVAPGDCRDKNNQVAHYTGYHLVCLAENLEGYYNMCRLNEEAWLTGYYYKPRVDKELLRKYHKGIIALSACLGGEVAAKLLLGADEAAEKVIDEYLDIFGEGNFFLELQDHGLPEDKTVCAKLLEIARRRNLPLVCTNDSHYLKREHAEAHEVFLCIGTQTTMNDPNRFRFPGGPEYYFKSPEEMAELFPMAPDALENTVKIAERCHIHIPTVDEDKANHYPEYPLPEGYDVSTPEIAKKERAKYLRGLAEEGMMERFKIDVNAPNHTPEE